MKPNRPYRALRAAVGTIAVLSVLALWAHAQLADEPLDMLWQLAVLIIVCAGAISVFGRRTFETAADTAKEISGDEEGGNGE